MTGAPRLLFHVQYLLGIGHRVRAERIARACAKAGFAVTLLDGGAPGPPPAEPPNGLTRVPLPPAKAADSAFSAILDCETGTPIDAAWKARRAEATLAALDAVRPDIVMVEGYPFARRAFAFELDPLIARARALGARTVVSIRDILVERRNPEKDARIAAQARALFDRVLVHGDPHFAQLADSFAAASAVADRIVYTGVVAPEPPGERAGDPSRAGDGTGEILVSAGGGATGSGVMYAALDARAHTRFADRTWRLLAGPNMPPSDLRQLRARAGAGFIIEAARRDFPTLLSRARLSISQAGYNTVADLAVSGCPAVLVPFAGPDGSESEQPVRAALLARAGRAIHLPEPALTATALAEAVEAAAALPRATGAPYRTDGPEATARALWDLLRGPAR